MQKIKESFKNLLGHSKFNFNCHMFWEFSWFNFDRPRSGHVSHWVCLSVCLSDCLSVWESHFSYSLEIFTIDFVCWKKATNGDQEWQIVTDSDKLLQIVTNCYR